MNITAVVVAGARHAALDVLAPVAGVPMVVWAVRALLDSGLVEGVVVLDDRRGEVRLACAGLPVDVVGGGLAGVAPSAGTTDVVLVHDAARPLAPPELAVALVEAARGAAVVPVLALADTVKQVDGAGVVRATPDRSALRVVQTPQALVGLALLQIPPVVDPLTAAVGLAASGEEVRTVPGDPLAFAVRSAWDLELAELMLRRFRSGRAGS